MVTAMSSPDNLQSCIICVIVPNCKVCLQPTIYTWKIYTKKNPCYARVWHNFFRKSSSARPHGPQSMPHICPLDVNDTTRKRACKYYANRKKCAMASLQVKHNGEFFILPCSGGSSVLFSATCWDANMRKTFAQCDDNYELISKWACRSQAIQQKPSSTIRSRNRVYLLFIQGWRYLAVFHISY